jgi:hypothetical protein
VGKFAGAKTTKGDDDCDDNDNDDNDDYDYDDDDETVVKPLTNPTFDDVRMCPDTYAVYVIFGYGLNKTRTQNELVVVITLSYHNHIRNI